MKRGGIRRCVFQIQHDHINARPCDCLHRHRGRDDTPFKRKIYGWITEFIFELHLAPETYTPDVSLAQRVHARIVQCAIASNIGSAGSGLQPSCQAKADFAYKTIATRYGQSVGFQILVRLQKRVFDNGCGEPVGFIQSPENFGSFNTVIGQSR